MKLQYREFRFLLFFLPIYFLKLINITASNKLLIIVSFVCFLMVLFGFINERISKKVITIYMIFILYTTILVFTCNKQGAFFSLIMIVALYKINVKNIYKYCFLIGIFGVLVSSYLERNGAIGIRYIGGVWTEIFKRSNILYISFVTVVCFYLYMKKVQKVKISELIIIYAFSYGMYKYSGSRTGFLSIIILLILLFLFRYEFICKNVFIKLCCILSPLIGMIISLVTAYSYGQIPVMFVLDNMMQGRLAQGNAYLKKYSFKFFGQKIFESMDSNNFCNLDCAYLDMLICYGIIFGALWIWLSCKVIKYLYERKRYIEVATIVMYSVYGISETFLSNGFLNVSIFLYAEYVYFLLNTYVNTEGELKNEKNKNCSNVSATIS